VIEENLPLNDYYWVIIIGVIGGICGIIYNKSTMKTLQLYDKIPYLKKHQKVIIPILLSGILGLFIPTVLAGGHKLVEYLNSDHVLLSMLFIYLIVKFLFSIISFGSGAPGGIFFPLLILGSLIGAIIGKIALMCGVDEILFANFIIITMAAFFASIVRAPLTGIILIAEMCGTLKILLPIALASFIAYVIANMLGCEPIYESLLSRIVTKNQSDYYIEQKELVTFIVEMGSVLEGAKVKDVHLPRPCLFVSVVRGNKEYIPRGETEFHAGDEVIMLVDKSYYKMAKDELAQLFKESSD
jgi:H+/Cl- antiporter ClcA